MRVGVGKEGRGGISQACEEMGRGGRMCVTDVFTILMELWFEVSGFTKLYSLNLCNLLNVNYTSILKSNMFIHCL